MEYKDVLTHFAKPRQRIGDFVSLKNLIEHIEYVGKHHNDYLEHNAQLYKSAFIHVISTGRMAVYAEHEMYRRTIGWLVKMIVENEVTCQLDASKVIGEYVKRTTKGSKK